MSLLSFAELLELIYNYSVIYIKKLINNRKNKITTNGRSNVNFNMEMEISPTAQL
jgi:hypothetical protein